MNFTNKDLDYLKDIFSWNYIACNNLSMINDNDDELLEDVHELFDSNMKHILNILGGAI